MEDLVITGSGVLSPAVNGATGLWEAMAARKKFFKKFGSPTDEDSPSWPFAEVSAAELSWPEGASWVDIQKYANLSSHLAINVASVALRGNESAKNGNPARSGVVIAAGTSGNDELDQVMPRIAAMSQADLRPLPKLLYDEVPDYSYIRGIPVQMGQFVSMVSGFQGANAAVNGEAGVGGLGALALAVRLLNSNELDRVLVVGVAPRLSCAAMAALNDDDPLATDSSIGRGPFDVDRAGTIIGQGAAALLIERADAAHGRGATPLANLLACETICAVNRLVAAKTAVQMVVGQAGRNPAFWWAHGSGSPEMDLDECHAVAPEIGVVPTTSSKGTIGNAFECSALIDAALTVESLTRAQVPPVGLLRKSDPALGDIDPVIDKPRTIKNAGAALVTAFTHGRGTAMAGAVMLAGRRRHE